VNLDGTPTTKASMNNNVLTAKETGQVVVIAQPKDHSLSCYYPMNIVGGYIEDDIENYMSLEKEEETGGDGRNRPVRGIWKFHKISGSDHDGWRPRTGKHCIKSA
jgi:hypothetical protein